MHVADMADVVEAVSRLAGAFISLLEALPR